MQFNGGHPRCQLHWAVRRGDMYWLKRLLEHKEIDVNEQDAEGFSPLHRAQQAHHFAAARELLLHPSIKLPEEHVTGHEIRQNELQRWLIDIFNNNRRSRRSESEEEELESFLVVLATRHSQLG